MTSMRRAIGIIRVSQVGGREGESFASPSTQRERIRGACTTEGLRLLDVLDETNSVSGGAELDHRPGLGPAVEAVEAGRADVIVAAYFDRLFRNLEVQAQVIRRVEAAGGEVLAVDVGQVTNGSAAQWLSGTVTGAMSEYFRRSARERSGEAQAAAVARGVLPYPNVPPGYRRGDDGVLAPTPAEAKIVVEAFGMRAAGATVNEVRAHLRANGVERSHHGVGAMLASRVYLGEIHFGDLLNLEAHPAIVDVDTWKRVQRARVSRGRKSKSERLLARLGVLRCGSCDARMVVGTSNNSAYWIYRCPPTGDCQRRVTISAEHVERIVVDTVRAALGDAEGRASAEHHARDAEVALERAQANLDAAIRTFDGLEDEQAARERLGELRDVRDRAQDRVEHLGGSRVAVVVNAAEDWDRLSLDARRALIRATVERVLVAPGRGDRVTVELVGE